MNTIKQFIAMLLCISLCMPLAQAQTSPGKRQETQLTNTTAQDVLIVIQQEQVRFTAQTAVEEMRLQVFDQAGQLVYDSGVATGSELTWVLRQASGEAVKSGLYAYKLSVKEAGAETARERRGHFIVDRASDRDGKTDRLWITSQNDGGVGAELTVARNEDVTIAGTSAPIDQKSARAPERNTRDEEVELKGNSNAVAAAAVSGTTGRIAKFTSAEDLGDSVITELDGKVGIGVATPFAGLHVGANRSVRYELGAGYRLSMGGIGTLEVDAVNVPGGRFIVKDNGNVGIGLATPFAGLHVGANRSVRYELGAGHRLSMGGIGTLEVDAVNVPGGRLIVKDNGNVGIGASDPQAKLDVVGTTRTSALEITGGADFAENFEVNVKKADNEAMTAKVEAGMVVSIDPATPGKLQLSAQAYDRRVAGVISGAGGVKPGMVMSQEGTLADGKYPVALTGRVYCLVDASQGAIEPGDLLTTSSTPGHAMKATDRKKSQGAIIGKAMTGLKEGKGFVLVLVNLQ